MRLKHLIAFVLGMPAVVCGDSLRGNQEKEEALVDAQDVATGHEVRRVLKLNGAQKRAIQRDERRYRNGQVRTQREEEAEKERKRMQAWNRDNPAADPNDPYEGDRYFREKRELNRYAHCEIDGDGCGFVTDWPTYERIVRADRQARRNERLYDLDVDCSLYCSSRNHNCIEKCRDEVLYDLNKYYDRRSVGETDCEFECDYDDDVCFDSCEAEVVDRLYGTGRNYADRLYDTGRYYDDQLDDTRRYYADRLYDTGRYYGNRLYNTARYYGKTRRRNRRWDD